MRGFVESPTCSEDLQLFNFTSIVETSRAHMAESSSLLTSQSATNDSGRAAPQAAPLQRRNTIETGWLEFNDWLETRLEDLGLDANLYSRLIHSVLRQQPINSDESSRQSSVKTTLVEILRSDSDQVKMLSYAVFFLNYLIN